MEKSVIEQSKRLRKVHECIRCGRPLRFSSVVPVGRKLSRFAHFFCATFEELKRHYGIGKRENGK